MLENVRLAFYGIWGHKLRSGLTMLGIIIGIAAITAIVSTIRGTNERISQNLFGSGGNSVIIQLCDGDFPIMTDYYPPPEGIPLVSAELKAEIERLREVDAVSLFTSRGAHGSVFYGSRSMDGGAIYGVDGDYFTVRGYSVYSGRGFVEDDYELCRKVVILDEAAAFALFPDRDPIDETIEILGEAFVIIGISKQSAEFMPDIDSMEAYYSYINTGSGSVFLPDSAWPVIYRFDEPQSVAVKAVNTGSKTSAGKKAADILNAHLALPTDSPIKYKSQDELPQTGGPRELTGAALGQLIWIAGISLLFGGFGVMKIMLDSVGERFREIGLRKALGARKSIILLQFLTEAVVLTCVGGVIGIIAGMVLSRIVSGISVAHTSTGLTIILVGLLFSLFIGLLFGLFPAVKASNQNTIDALRHQQGAGIN